MSAVPMASNASFPVRTARMPTSGTAAAAATRPAWRTQAGPLPRSARAPVTTATTQARTTARTTG